MGFSSEAVPLKPVPLPGLMVTPGLAENGEFPREKLRPPGVAVGGFNAAARLKDGVWEPG